MKEEFQILNTWNLNAKAWINTIAHNEIESRRLVTNKAIEDVIISLNPEKILDLGCGEGWLIRSLQEKIPNATFIGLDAVPALIDQAKILSPDVTFLVHTYQSIIQGQFIPPGTVDLIVINFALFGDDIVQQLLKSIHLFISAGGHLVIQTLHPYVAHEEGPYVDGWKQGSWKGFSDDFTSPAPWYFRTLESWISLFTICGYSLKKIVEPIHPVTLRPASIIFILSV